MKIDQVLRCSTAGNINRTCCEYFVQVQEQRGKKKIRGGRNKNCQALKHHLDPRTSKPRAIKTGRASLRSRKMYDPAVVRFESLWEATKGELKEVKKDKSEMER